MRSELIRFIREGHSFSGHERHCCYLNTHGAKFANVSAASHLDYEDDGRAAARVDWDQDGDVDFWISNRNAPQVRFLRNDVPSDNHFVALRLQGTTCNRDGIGSRVELITNGSGSRRQMQTLRAGDGYLSQSSKWLHFGLGPDTRIDRVVVRWPGGEREEFAGVTCDHRFLLVQGSGQADECVDSRQPPLLQPTSVSLPSSSEAMHVFSATQLAVPPLSYETFAGEPQTVTDLGRQPVLVNLWATWCQPCLAELSSFAANEADLRAAGLEIVALSVDGLSGSSQTEGQGAESFLRGTKFPFLAGAATDELINLFQILNNQLFAFQRPLPVPTSFLFNAQGRLAAVYKGPVDVDQLLTDLTRLSLTGESKRDASVPFAGRWMDTPKMMTASPLAVELINNGLLSEASVYLAQNRSQVVPDSLYVSLLLRLARAFEERGDSTAAAEHFRRAEQADPKLVMAEVQHGLALEALGRAAEATEKYRAALRRNPRNLSALNNLAWILATNESSELRNGAEAVKLAELAASITRQQNASVLDTLSAAYAEAGAFDRAAATAKKAAGIARARGNAAMADRIDQRRLGYQRGRAYREGS